MPKLPPVHRYVSDSGVRVYRIPCQVLPTLTGRAYLLLGAGPPTLVDTGSGTVDSTRNLLAGLETVRTEFGEKFGLRDLRRILITHSHFDHFGGLAELVDETDAEVGVHGLDRRLLDAYDERAAVYNVAFRRFFVSAGIDAQRRRELIEVFGYHQARFRSVPVDFTLDDGQDLDGLKIHHTPGHSPGHVCIAVGDILLAGDHVLARTLTQQWPESTAPFTGLGHYLDSLEKIGRVGEFSLVLSGHEFPVRDLPKRIEEIRSGQNRRIDRVLEVLQKAGRPLSIGEISDKMYSRQRGIRTMLAVADVGARVEYLDQRGCLTVADLGGADSDEVEEFDTPVFRYGPA